MVVVTRTSRRYQSILASPLIVWMIATNRHRAACLCNIKSQCNTITGSLYSTGISCICSDSRRNPSYVYRSQPIGMCCWYGCQVWQCFCCHPYMPRPNNITRTVFSCCCCYDGITRSNIVRINCECQVVTWDSYGWNHSLHILPNKFCSGYCDWMVLYPRVCFIIAGIYSCVIVIDEVLNSVCCLCRIICVSICATVFNSVTIYKRNLVSAGRMY